MHTFVNAVCFYKKIQNDSVITNSAYTSLYIILSLPPFAMFFLTLLRFTALTSQDLLNGLQLFLPQQLISLIQHPVQNLYTQTSSSLISFSLIAAIWSASRGAYGLVRGLHAVYHVTEKRNYFVTRFLAMLYTVVFGLLLISTLLLLVFGNTIQLFILQNWPLIGHITGTILSLRALIVTVFLLCFFLLLYRVLPDQKGKLKQQLPGAVLATCGWSSVSFFFSLYVDRVNGLSVAYRVLTTATLLIFWLNICINIVLIGGAFNHWLANHHTFD